MGIKELQIKIITRPKHTKRPWQIMEPTTTVTFENSTRVVEGLREQYQFSEFEALAIKW